MIGITILAAGSSSRMGKPKQNLVYDDDQTLLRLTCSQALAVSGNVLVVLGANAEEIRPSIANLAIKILYNPDWQEGMSSSIRSAITYFNAQSSKPDAVLFLLCDQPHVNARLLANMVDAASGTAKGIIACGYNKTIGVPALFKPQYFLQLSALKGNEGARQILSRNKADIHEIDFPLGSVDIDTEEDFIKLKNSQRV